MMEAVVELVDHRASRGARSLTIRVAVDDRPAMGAG